MIPDENLFTKLSRDLQNRIQQTSHSSIIFIAILIVSCSNGTGRIPAADSNSFRTSFPLAVIYCVVVGTPVLLLSDNF